MTTQNATTNARFLKGNIIFSSPPVILETCSPNRNAKAFYLKICDGIETTGAFMLYGVQCKLLNNQIVPDVKVHENSKYFSNCTTDLLKPGQIFLKNEKNNSWIDLSTTTQIIQKNSENRLQWLILSKQLEKKFMYSKTEIRKLFRTLKLSGVKELVDWLVFFFNNNYSEFVVYDVLKSATSKKMISDAFGIPCQNFEAVQEAMRHFITII